MLSGRKGFAIIRRLMANAYTVLARRYRSQTFDELVGQEAIAQTLKNAIKSDRVAHAFLFTGTRGVGKTSAARILAKAINCPNRGADGNPCGACETCKAIARGEDMDVIEIDGASNNSVDQIRDLRQSAGIRPARSPYKIYIIDEVHMLSTGAFNALLKTLEEPPEHVKFIFATTDVHKVPATIISRCQRFDFKNIPTQRIAEHLTHVVKDEGVEADGDALFRIARLGNGSMRDALSILDRVLSMGEKQITDKILEELLGKPPTAAIGQLVDAIANGDAAGAITLSDRLLKDGMGVEQVLSEVIEFLRNVMMVVACGDKTDLLDVPAESRGIFITLARKFDAPTVVHLMALGEQTLRSLKSSTMHRPLFDALIVRLALSEQFSSIRQLLANADGSELPSNPPIAGQKKSSIDRVDPVAAAAVMETALPVSSLMSASDSAQPVEEVPEESIYEQMKATMRRQKEEQDAKNAAMKQQRGPAQYGRPGPVAVKPAEEAVIERVSDVTDLAAVWGATRRHLNTTARYLESVLGHCCRVGGLNRETGETVLVVPGNQKGFTNEKARAKIEECLRGDGCGDSAGVAIHGGIGFGSWGKWRGIAWRGGDDGGTVGDGAADSAGGA